MSGSLFFDTYDSGLGREQMLCAGEGPRRLLIIPPLFDEMNRMRRTLVLAMRTLAGMGVSCILPDLPGLNESKTPLHQCQLADWNAAINRASIEANVTHVASLRSACVLDGALNALPRWRNAAIGGDRVITQLVRAQMASDKANGIRSFRADYDNGEGGGAVHLAGFMLSAAMVQDLNQAALSHVDGAQDCQVDASLGPPLWLRAEPGESPEFARALAASWREWMVP